MGSGIERLEGRALLAISTAAVPGDQSGGVLAFVSDDLTGPNALAITLRQDQSGGTPYVFASVDTGGGGGAQDYFNFSSITFSGAAGVIDSVIVSTQYQADLVGFGASGTGAPLSATNWQLDASFAVPNLPTALFDLFNADVLQVTAGTLGSSAASTIAGQFQPTNSPAAGIPSVVLEDRGMGIAGNAAQDPIQTFGLSMKATNGPISLGASITVDDDLSIVANSGSITLGSGALSTVSSSAGDIVIRSHVGSVTVNNVAISTVQGDIEISSSAQSSIAGGASAGLSAPAGKVVVAGSLGLTLSSVLPISADRLELSTNGTGLIQLTNTAINELEATTGGSLEVTSSKAVTISDGDPLAVSNQIKTAAFSLTAPAGIRVIDGLNVSGGLVLSTWNATASTSNNPVTPSIPVEFVVTTTTDTVNSSFDGELRDMIGYVNRNGINAQAAAQGITRQPTSIVFDELGSPIAAAGVVTLSAALPALSRLVTFDGSLPDSTRVGIDGSGIVGNANGLRLAAGSSGSTVQDAAFHGFARGAGIRVESAANLLTGLSVGVDRDGAADANSIGIDLAGTSAVRNVIGVKTSGVDTGNTIAANTFAGVLIRSGANYTSLYGNQIGAATLGNGDGIWVQGSLGTIIGAVGAGLANTIDSNTRNGIRVSSVNATTTRFGTQIIGNTISNNEAVGVLVEGGMQNVVGGRNVGEGNVIADNRVGISMTVDGLRQTWGNQIVGNTVSGMSKFDIGGILVDRGYANVIQANSVSGLANWGIRLLATAVARGQVANQVIQNTVTQSGATADDGGIVVENSSGQIVGGAGTRANSVTQNGGSGIVVIGGTGPSAASGNQIVGNLVGTNAAGEDLGNAFDGIRIRGSLANVVQGNTVRFNDAGNLANPAAGISVYDAVSPVTGLGNRIVSNSVADNSVGVLISGGARTQIGGLPSGAANWVFRNLEDGIRVTDSPATGAARATVIQGNRVGMATASAAAGNNDYGINLINTVGTVVDAGNMVVNSGSSGIRITGGSGIAIGSATGKGNTVQSNGVTQTGNGIEVLPPGVAAGRTENVTIAGNVIRLNTGYGIRVGGTNPDDGSVSGVTVGRSAPGLPSTPTANTITQNGLAGVFVDRAQAVAVYGNTIVNNGGQPIEWASGTGFEILLTSARRTAASSNGQFEVRGTVGRMDTALAQTARVSVYGTNTATGERFLLGQVSVVLRAGVDLSAFRLLVGSAGRRFDRIEASVSVGLSTVASSNPVAV